MNDREPDRIATRNDWKNEPLPRERAVLHVEWTFSPDEMNLIRRGLIPEVMEDKWFIFFEDDTLYMHRSWTGFCTYVAHFEKAGEDYAMTRLEANRNTDQYSADDADLDARMFLFLVDCLLLGREAEFPVADEETSPQDAAVHQWHLIGRAMLGDEDA